MDEIVIDIDQLRQRYGRFEAVRGVSLRVPRGELFALLGTNGAGKTTTIEALEGCGAPATGGCGCSGWTRSGTVARSAGVPG